MSKKLIVVVGVGPGVGLHTAKKFGAQGFRVVLVARRQEALAQYVEELTAEGIDADAVAADAASTASVAAAFDHIKQRHGTTDVLLYNAVALKTGQPSTLTAEDLVSHFQVDVAGALRAALQVIPDQVAQREGTILITGGGLAIHPAADYAAKSIGKAGVRSLTYTLAEELEPKGIYVGTVTIAGPVSPGTSLAPELIAEKFWELYTTRDVTEVVMQS